MTIQELKNLEMHDLGIECFQVDFTDKKISLTLAFYNEEKEDYDYREIVFTGVEGLVIDMPELQALDDNEIYSHEVVMEEGRKPRISFLLLCGFSRPSANLIFLFSACHWAAAN
jgi:hypothetical protein